MKLFFVIFVFVLINTCSCKYVLVDNYSGTSFFDRWTFFTANDPTNGYVNYVGRDEAISKKLAFVYNGTAVMKADDTNVASGRGRDSIRITSNKSYNYGLFLIDASHMPFGCGTWPAFWLVGPNWPNSGEVDIIEGVNTNDFDATTLHTNYGCVMSSSHNSFTGRWANGTNNQPATNCWVDAPNQAGNQGCSIQANKKTTYGAAFNSVGGGVFATEWTNTGIKVWFFERNEIPQDIKNNDPNPSSWGLPYASFDLGLNCPASHFQNQQIVFDLTFCGDWAGAVFPSQCTRSVSCQDYVKNNPSYFKEAFWAVNYVKVFFAQFQTVDNKDNFIP